MVGKQERKTKKVKKQNYPKPEKAEYYRRKCSSTSMKERLGVEQTVKEPEGEYNVHKRAGSDNHPALQSERTQAREETKMDLSQDDCSHCHRRRHVSSEISRHVFAPQ